MFIAQTEIRVRYAETDQMGYVYYGNYGQFYEVARVEAMRCMGLEYKMIEEKGIMMPVVELHVEYKRPAFYDDLLILKTYIEDIPATRIKFLYEIYNSNDKLLNQGHTIHAFVHKDNRKPISIPDWMLEKIKNFQK